MNAAANRMKPPLTLPLKHLVYTPIIKRDVVMKWCICWKDMQWRSERKDWYDAYHTA